ncbi:MAG: FHA domain-containing protein [Planctomycetota bacterium]
MREYQFAQGPVHIGRKKESHIVLADGAISREHAVISCTQDGRWFVKDLGSANKTFLNWALVTEGQIRAGDVLRIVNFTIELRNEEEVGAGDAAHSGDTIHLEATLATPPHDIVVRTPDAAHAPSMRLPASRLTDFSDAVEQMGETGSYDELLQVILAVLLKQFNALSAWCALREQPRGPMMYHAGSRRDGTAVQIDNIMLRDKIHQSVAKGRSIVLPRVSAEVEAKEKIRSAMIASIKRREGCFGAMYVDNAIAEKHYSLSDLDYMMLLAIYVSNLLKKFQMP